MTAALDTEFSIGDEFIGFGDSASEAGPSRSQSPQPPASSSAKGKGRAHDSDAERYDNGDSSAAESKGSKKRKGKGKELPPRKKAKGENGPITGPRNKKEEDMANNRHAPWAVNVDWERSADTAEMLNSEVRAFYDHMSPSVEEYTVRRDLIDYLSALIRSNFPGAEVTPFGSWQTQLYLPTGDIDLVVYNPQLENAPRNKVVNFLHHLAALMKRRLANQVVVIAKAKVPIVKFATSDALGEINIDISVNQTNGISAGKIMRHYLDAYPGSRELILVVKAFLQQRSMNEVFSGGLGSYSVICLVLSFLQLHPKIRRSEINPLNNLGVLLMEFFELYGRSFNYNDVGISLRRGGNYYSKRKRGWSNAQQGWLLSIEDPQDMDNDISKTSFGIREVKLVLAGAYDILQGVLAERAQQLEKGQIGHLRPSELSILGSILGAHPKAVKFRAHLKAMYAERRVQRLISKDLGRLPDDLPDVHPPPPQSRSEKSSKAAKAAPEPKRTRKARTPSPAGKDEFNAILVDDDSDPEPGAVWESDSSGSERAAPRSAKGKARSPSVSGSEDGEILDAQPKGKAKGNGKASGLQIKGLASRLSVSEDEVDFEALAAARDGSPEESRYDLGKANGKAKEGSRAGSKAPASKPPSKAGSKPPSRAGSVAGSKPPSRAGSATPAVPPSPSSRKVKTSERKAFWAAKAGQTVDEEDDDYIALSSD
ncbi:hypothetical protein VHUM_03104 [Vanrija humicola]|uniref:polynucleotide adenylyltransferase n=1 Tax=Vanrija humicola TaxID=5417 RepID=A0A7D8Z2A2_VANHU|nr:hypothetical protein VHUM_03104 [Vanrija humicola]